MCLVQSRYIILEKNFQQRNQMREYIYRFEQNILIEIGVNHDQCLLLDYLITLYNSGRAKTMIINGKRYVMITYPKIQSDLPILHLSIRTLGRLLSDLEQKQVIKKALSKDHRMYIYINSDLLFYGRHRTKLPWVDQSCGQNVVSHMTKCPIIVSYNINNIYIDISKYNARENKLNTEEFVVRLQESLRPHLTNMDYNICVKNIEVESVTEDTLELYIPASKLLREKHNSLLPECIASILDDLLQKKDTP